MLGTAGDLLAVNNLLELADTLRSQQDNEKIHVPLGTLHTEPTDTTPCAVITTTDETDSNVKLPMVTLGSMKKHQSSTPVKNPRMSPSS